MNEDLQMQDPLGDPKNGHILTRAIIETIHEPLIVLDEKLCVIAASQSFYTKFNVNAENTQHHLFYELGSGEWNIPALRNLLEEVIPKQSTVRDYEVSHDFKMLGKRTMLVNARSIEFENVGKKMLLSIFDITKERLVEDELKNLLHEKNILLEQKNNLLNEMRHRIANSLQLIASIILLKAGSSSSDEARKHLEDTHERIISIASVQRQLDPTGTDGTVNVAPYLKDLCANLTKSMIGGRKPITLMVYAESGSVTSDEATSLGLLTTELVINALKHAFPGGEGKITVTYTSEKDAWTLLIADDGVGYSMTEEKPSGLGTSIVDSLADQLEAKLTRESSSNGTSISLIHSIPSLA
ncbi:sensor histidine kinase [Patescibacteria group bacterium]|nr:sensor histidine kinase [Patescibacteria group bacterium]